MIFSFWIIHKIIKVFRREHSAIQKWNSTLQAKTKIYDCISIHIFFPFFPELIFSVPLAKPCAIIVWVAHFYLWFWIVSKLNWLVHSFFTWRSFVCTNTIEHRLYVSHWYVFYIYTSFQFCSDSFLCILML